MQTPAPRTTPTPTFHELPGDTDDRTVRLTTPAIRRAAVAPPTRAPLAAPYRPQPYPHAAVRSPATTAALVDASPGIDGSDDDSTDADAPKFALTATQVTASMSAAVIAAFIGAQLGVAGTIVGAAIASVVSVVGSAVIGHSLLLTRRTVTKTVHHVRVGAGSPADAADTVLLTAVTRRVEIEHAAPARPGPATGTTGGPTSRRRGWWSRPGRLRWLLVGLIASAAVFAAALGAVTVVEAVKGAPISGGNSGFSVLGGNRGTGPQDAPSSSSRTTVTETTTAPPTTTSSSAPGTSSSATSSSPTSSATTSTTASATTPATSAPTTAASTRASAGTGTAAAPPAG
ncbi:hypothetical protein [Nakamurella sp.]|uniref:hypothetical protein n=1 Tax=Nakamurella sp. TaxID=1869182 RepID=UPI0037835768